MLSKLDQLVLKNKAKTRRLEWQHQLDFGQRMEET
jgi:hypothetical protein